MSTKGRDAKTINLEKFLNLRNLVDSNILSQHEACKALDITPYLYRKWEAKCKNITLDDINRTENV